MTPVPDTPVDEIQTMRQLALDYISQLIDVLDDLDADIRDLAAAGDLPEASVIMHSLAEAHRKLEYVGQMVNAKQQA